MPVAAVRLDRLRQFAPLSPNHYDLPTGYSDVAHEIVQLATSNAKTKSLTSTARLNRKAWNGNAWSGKAWSGLEVVRRCCLAQTVPGDDCSRADPRKRGKFIELADDAALLCRKASAQRTR
jgi:hypothetical protein